MLKSMTGYGQGTVSGDTFTVTVDLRSVNNRNLDIHWRAPQDLASLEVALKKQIQAALSRGRVDVTVSFSQTADSAYELNRPLIRGYLEALRVMREEFGLTGDADLATLSRLPNVLLPKTASNTLSDAVVQGVEAALTHALAALVAMRAVEGHELQKELLSRVERIEKQVAIVESGADGLVDAYRDKLRNGRRSRDDHIMTSRHVTPGIRGEVHGCIGDRSIDHVERCQRIERRQLRNGC